MKIDQVCRINQKRKAREQILENMETTSLVQIIHAEDIASQAVFVAETIKQILNQHPATKPGDVAVVSRQGISYPSLVAMRMALAKENIDFCHSIQNSES